jgi:hypothetical protein
MGYRRPDGQRWHQTSKPLGILRWKFNISLEWLAGFRHQRITSEVQSVVFVSETMSYIILSSRWCYIVVLNVQAAAEVTTDYRNGSLYKELECLC